MRKILFFIGTETEQGFLFSVISELLSNGSTEVYVLTSNEYDFFQDEGKILPVTVINIEVKNANAPAEVVNCHKMGLVMEKTAITLQELNPDLIVLGGNGQEAFCCASVATIFNIPIAHVHDDEESSTAVNESFRHSITKMSHIHVTNCKIQKQRILQLGEKPALVLTKEAFEEHDLAHLMHNAQVKNMQCHADNVSFTQFMSKVFSTVTLDGLIKKKFFDMENIT